MNWLLIHSVISPLVVGLPLFVVLVARWVVRRDAEASGRSLAFTKRDLNPLTTATVIGWAIFATWITLDAPSIAAGLRQSFLGIAEIASSMTIFWFFAVPVLSNLERVALSSVQRDIAASDTQYRGASLLPREVSNYLPMPMRAIASLVCLIALAYVAIQVSMARPEARLMLPIVYGAVAATFFGLYEFWLRAEALGAQALSSANIPGRTPEDAELARRWRVREIFFLQSALTLLFSAIALLALGVNWQSPSGRMVAVSLGVVAAMVGGVGCAFALSSNMRDRTLRVSIMATDA